MSPVERWIEQLVEMTVVSAHLLDFFKNIEARFV